jgi:hypothetical protein
MLRDTRIKAATLTCLYLLIGLCASSIGLCASPCGSRANAFAERFVRTLRHEVLDLTLVFGRRNLDQILRMPLTCCGRYPS